MNITYTDKAKLLPPHKPITTRYTDSDTATLLPLHRANSNNMNHHRLGEGRAAAGQQISEHTHTHTPTLCISWQYGQLLVLEHQIMILNANCCRRRGRRDGTGLSFPSHWELRWTAVTMEHDDRIRIRNKVGQLPGLFVLNTTF